MHTPFDKRVFDKQARSLVAAGFSVIHLCPGPQKFNGVRDGVLIQTYSRPVGLFSRFIHLYSLYKLASQVRADAYHCNEVDSWGIGVALKLFQKKLCVFDVHEHYPSTFAESRFPKIFRPIVSAFIRIVFNILTPFTDRIVLAKSSVGSDFSIDSSNKILVRNFSPLSTLKFAKSPLPSEEKSFITLVHLGLISKLRGWPQILEALDMMSCKNVRLLIIGEFNDNSIEDFIDRAALLGLTDRVTILEWMPFENAFLHLLNADIGIVAFQPGITNHIYAMPHKMFDYMAAGLAVAVPEFAVEVAPIIEDTKCGVLIDPSNPQNIADKLDALLKMPKLITEMGLRGKKAVCSRYNWEAEVKLLIQMYEKLEKEI